jgi:CheY-like chemotaxis protein
LRETARATPDGLAGPGRQVRAPGGRGVLVVDDEPAVRHLAQAALRTLGYDVTVASGGREALRAVYGAATPALLLTAIDMPGMTGIELAARLTAERPSVRVIFMTPDAESAARARDRTGFVAAVLLKPFTSNQLRDVVRVAIGEPPGR